MRASESISVTLSTGTNCAGGVWAATLKVHKSLGCTDTTCPTLEACHTNISSSTTRDYVATQDGWVYIVADSSTGNEGVYTINVKLTCSVAGCDCP